MLDFTLHHISLNVSNLEDSIKFYEIFGFQEFRKYLSVDETLSIVHLLNDKFIIELFYYPNSELSNISNDKYVDSLGINHFSFRTKNLVDTLEYFEKIFNRKLKIIEGRTGIQYFFILDPDGNKIEIVQDNKLD